MVGTNYGSGSRIGVRSEVFYAYSDLTPLSLWTNRAQGLRETSFASPNLNFSRDLYYVVVPVRTVEVAKGQSERIVGEASNIAISRAADSNEFAKRLGIQDYWAYESVDSPVGEIQIEKSMGNLVFQQTDRQLEGDTFLQDGITRTHNSQSSLIFPFGQGTDFSYNVELIRQMAGDSYVFKDDTGTLRTFVHSEVHGTYFTRDSKRARLSTFDEPRPVRVRTQVGVGNAPSTYETLLVGYVVTLHKRNEYWFNQGGQLILVTDAPELLNTSLADEASYHSINPADQNYLVLSYCPDTGLLTKASSNGNRHIRFAHNTERLISAVLLPDGSVISYSYENNRLASVRKHENLISEHNFLAGAISENSTEDIVYTYGWSRPSLWSNRYYKTAINGVERYSGAEVPQTTIKYEEFEKDELFVRAIAATNSLGDRTEISYSGNFILTDVRRTPYGLSSPTTATQTRLTLSGHSYLTLEGTVADVEIGDAQRTYQQWDNHLLASTTTLSEYHTLSEDGIIATHIVPSTTTTGYNTLELPVNTVEIVGTEVVSTTDISYDQTGINEESVTSEIAYDEHGDIEYFGKWEFDEYGLEIYFTDITHESTTIREYYANGRLKRELTSLQRFEDGVTAGNPVPQSEMFYEYDSWGNTTREVHTEFGSPNVVRESTRSFDFMGRLVFEQTGIVTSSGTQEVRTVQNTYDRDGRLTESRATEPDGTVTTTSTDFNKDGTVKSQTDELGITTAFIYDIAGRTLSTIVSAPGLADKITTVAYGFAAIDLNTSEGTRAYENAQVTISTDAAGLVTRGYADALGRTIRVSAAGLNTDTTHTACGKAFATVVLPESLPREYARTILALFDAGGNQTHSIEQPVFGSGNYRADADSIVASSTFDASSRALSSTDALGNTTYFTYDEKGRMATATMPEVLHVLPGSNILERSAATVSFANEEIDAGGTTTTTTNALGYVSALKSDPSGKALSVTDFGRNSADAQASTDSAPITTTFTYNDLGQLVRETLSNGDYRLYFYDVNGNAIRTEFRRVDNTLEATSISTFDNRGRLTSITDYSGVPDPQNVIYYQAFEYDTASKMVARFEGHVKPGVIAEDQKTHLAFDSAERLIGVTYPVISDNSELMVTGLDYHFDDFGRLATITARISEDGEARTATLREYSYDLWGQVGQIRDRYDLSNPDSTFIIKTYTRDDLGRITNIDYAMSGSLDTVFESFTYTFDKNHNITSEHHIVELDDVPAHNEFRTYIYDEIGRLIKSESTVNGTNIYGWDKAGNRRFVSEDGEEIWAIFNGLNQLTEKQTEAGTIAYSYCANGNQIRELGAGIDRAFNYSSDNRLTEVRDGTTLINANTYRSDGQRISKYEHGQTVYYTYLDGTVLYTADASYSPINFHLTTPDGQLIAWQHFDTDGTYFSGLTTDIRQSTSTVLGKGGSFLTGFRYTDFGETTKLSPTDELIEIAYTGGVWDSSTGFYYLNARFYNPVDARFLTLDVARNGGDLRATLSLYGYCEGDPINKVDPSGYSSERLPGHHRNNSGTGGTSVNLVAYRRTWMARVGPISGPQVQTAKRIIAAPLRISPMMLVIDAAGVIWRHIGTNITLRFTAERRRDRSVRMTMRISNLALPSSPRMSRGPVRADYQPALSTNNGGRYTTNIARRNDTVRANATFGSNGRNSRQWQISRGDNVTHVQLSFHLRSDRRSSHSILRVRVP